MSSLRQLLEDDDVVHTVEELRAELPFQLAHDVVFDPVLIARASSLFAAEAEGLAAR